MREQAAVRAFSDPALDVSAQLSREVGLLAGRLARMLADSPVARETPVAAGIDFLRTVAAVAPSTSALSERIARGVIDCETPLERVACAYALAAVEVDLLLLAGMAEEHEGFASLFRALHPTGAPRPTVGLAAQLLCTSTRERHAVRELLAAGAAVGSGALVLGAEGAAPFFEQSLLLGDAVWPTLAGVETWPARITPLTVLSMPGALAEWLGG